MSDQKKPKKPSRQQVYTLLVEIGRKVVAEHGMGKGIRLGVLTLSRYRTPSEVK